MALLTFTPVPGPTFGPSNYEVGFKVLRAPFGDNYSQRVENGMNAQTRTWNLTWENLTDAEANVIENFLIARKGTEAFIWTPNITGATAMKFTCERYTRTPKSHKYADIQAVFERVYDFG
jgi:phage-related protein